MKTTKELLNKSHIMNRLINNYQIGIDFWNIKVSYRVIQFNININFILSGAKSKVCFFILIVTNLLICNGIN